MALAVCRLGTSDSFCDAAGRCVVHGLVWLTTAPRVSNGLLCDHGLNDSPLRWALQECSCFVSEEWSLGQCLPEDPIGAGAMPLVCGVGKIRVLAPTETETPSPESRPFGRQLL